LMLLCQMGHFMLVAHLVLTGITSARSGHTQIHTNLPGIFF
jgi:hypothetical protein